MYEENGVLEYWVGYPEYKHIYVYLLNDKEQYRRPVINEAEDKISSVVLKGLKIKMSDIFKL